MDDRRRARLRAIACSRSCAPAARSPRAAARRSRSRAHPELAGRARRAAIVASRRRHARIIPARSGSRRAARTSATSGARSATPSVNTIVIHDTEGGWDASVATLQNDSGKSVHYIVDADGSRVGQFRARDRHAWHAGNYYYNERSVGIEHVGVARDPAGYCDGLYATSAALVKNIRTRWTVPLDRKHIVGHYQIPNGNDDRRELAAVHRHARRVRDQRELRRRGQPPRSRLPLAVVPVHGELGGCVHLQRRVAAVELHDRPDRGGALRRTATSRSTSAPNGCDVMPIGQDDVCHVADWLGRLELRRERDRRSRRSRRR